MKSKHRLNAIIIEDEMYVLTRVLGRVSDCIQCDLRDKCLAIDGNYTCTIFGVEKGYCLKRTEKKVHEVEESGHRGFRKSKQ